MRDECLKNIVLCGGLSHISGYNTRLYEELNQIIGKRSIALTIPELMPTTNV